ncbi:unnamed protein product [Polarella glacialis]|uniref:Uncharacterized protein n=1 Tax=Polarella glacialis TaxID=89957 RepID=A0A813GLP3_POLGL|nr:unnamed protein product [Polarella glacialis]
MAGVSSERPSHTVAAEARQEVPDAEAALNQVFSEQLGGRLGPEGWRKQFEVILSVDARGTVEDFNTFLVSMARGSGTSSCSEQAKYCATNRGGYDDPVSSGDCAKNSHKPDSAGNKLYNDHDSNDNNNCRENDISSKDHRPSSTTHDGHDTELTAQSHCNKSNSHSNNDKDDNNNKNNDDAHNNNNIHDNNTNDNNSSYCSHHFLSLAAVFLSVQTRDKAGRLLVFVFGVVGAAVVVVVGVVVVVVGGVCCCFDCCCWCCYCCCYCCCWWWWC